MSIPHAIEKSKRKPKQKRRFRAVATLSLKIQRIALIGYKLDEHDVDAPHWLNLIGNDLRRQFRLRRSGQNRTVEPNHRN